MPGTILNLVGAFVLDESLMAVAGVDAAANRAAETSTGHGSGTHDTLSKKPKGLQRGGLVVSPEKRSTKLWNRFTGSQGASIEPIARSSHVSPGSSWGATATSAAPAGEVYQV